MKFWQVVSFSEPDQLVEIARAAEEAGFHGVLLADHLFFPGNLRSRYPYSDDGKPGFDGTTPFPDPWTTIAAMSSVTQRLRFATMVVILPLRNPLELAKTLARSRCSPAATSCSAPVRAGSARSTTRSASPSRRAARAWRRW